MNAGDFNAAIGVLRPLAEAGNTAAQNNLGWLYFSGKGVPENDAEATKLFQQAAEKGKAAAQYNLGAAYEYGNGVPQDTEQALRWYRRPHSKAGPRPRSISAGCTMRGWASGKTRLRR